MSLREIYYSPFLVSMTRLINTLKRLFILIRLFILEDWRLLPITLVTGLSTRIKKYKMTWASPVAQR